MAFGKTECTCISFGPKRNVKESRDLYIKYKSHAIKSQAQVKYLDIDIDHLSIIKKSKFYISLYTKNALSLGYNKIRTRALIYCHFFIILAPLGFPAYPKFRKDFLITYA